ncbi:MAG TPA: hypothetical protein EYH30_06750 [Anaerolineales bacterium]|nr:hypothetical protein [Anaerolineales bacterium]
MVIIAGCSPPGNVSPTPFTLPTFTPRPEIEGQHPAPSPTPGAEGGTGPAQTGGQVVTYVPSEGIGHIAVRLTFPQVPRYADGAGVVVDVAPFFTSVDDFYEDLDAAPLGLIRVAYLWPGNESRSTGARSDGAFDYGGEASIRALRDVIRFAAGEIPDAEGRYIGDLSPFPVLTDQVGLYAFSHPGIAAVNVLALYGDQLEVRYFVGRENPTADALSAVEIGYWGEGGRPVLNPLYRYPDDYSPTGITLDYSTVRWAAGHRYTQQPAYLGYPYFDLNGNDRYDEGDFILGHKVPSMFDKRVYSAALTRALQENGALADEDWPADLATPEEAAAWWAFRITPPRYPLLAEKTPDLKVLLLFCVDDHVQPLADNPHIHQAYDGFHHVAGLWTRLNPDAAYLPAERFPGYQDHPANTEPDDWAISDDWGYPSVPVGTKLAPQGAVAEMADRTHEENWAPDLSAPLYPLEVSQAEGAVPPSRDEHPCGDGVCTGRETPQNCPQDCARPTGTGQPAGEGGARRGFIVVHCDPQEILNLHENYDPATFDYDGNGHYSGEDAWQALMDLVDLADAYGIHLTLQFSPPYIDFMRQPGCDALLGEGRVYPAAAGGVAYTHCIDLVRAWEANGHELSLHHHGPNHDPLKFDGYTNREVYAVKGQRVCSADDGPACGCEQGRCYWCAPPDSTLACRGYAGPPPGPVGRDLEWKGSIEGPDGMMALVYSVFDEGTIRSYCSNHVDEVSDMPSDPAIIYTTQGTGYDNAPAPMCIAYDVEREFHTEPKYAWFYSHGFVFNRRDLEAVKTTMQEMLSGEPGHVLGMVFHVNNFLRSEINPDDPLFGLTVCDLFAYLSAPEDGGGPVRIETLTDLMIAAGKTEAPDPCEEVCFSLDESSERASYTVPVSPPANCPSDR